MKNFLVTYINTNKQKTVVRTRGLNVEEVQSFFKRIYPDSKIIHIKKIK